MKTFLSTILLAVVSQYCVAQSKAPSHEIYDRLLKKHVTADGKVNYKSFSKDSVELNKYLKLLSVSPPDAKTWSRYEQMAYWINAYNAFTIKLILKYYPVASIKDIGSKRQIPFINTPWDIKFITIGKDKMDLNNIEHGNLRKNFDDPRVHMALVCASKSCPILLNEAYDAKRLDEQFAKQTKAFLTDPFRNKVTADKPQLSMLFKWYGMDFNKKDKTVRSFINTYSDVKIKPNAKLDYLDYDWGLNEQ
jgi:Protein of unknown function, DUF547